MGQPQNSGLLIFYNPERSRGIPTVIHALKNAFPPKGGFFIEPDNVREV
jgi:hypothetical protein